MRHVPVDGFWSVSVYNAAWALASLVPGQVDHLVALSVGHPSTFRRTPQQREKSWYVLLFQFPGIAERWLTEDNWYNSGLLPGIPTPTR